jgi:methylenetetrahydrofolate dehydrogenase (NADP+) / methenyltetrahydrofolate cyclohydrolase
MIEQAIVIDGKNIANEILANLKSKVEAYYAAYNIRPKLSIILIGDNEASIVYVKNKINASKKVGIDSELIKFEADVSEQLVLKTIYNLNQDDKVSGIIVQMPVPNHISKAKLVNSIDPNKDVDGFNPVNVGMLYSGFPLPLAPCTAKGCVELIKYCEPNLSGKKVVIIGRSNIVGRPLAALLLQEDCTITICHSKTQNLMKITQDADIVVSAVGNPHFLTKEYFNENAIVIDVGINRINLENKYELVGDVDFYDVQNKVRYITPVPGGVGPMTVAYLLVNTFEALIMNKK